MVRSLVLAARLLAIAGCTTPYFERETVALIPETVNWRPWGMNYQIEGLVQDSKGERVTVTTFGTDCLEGYGSLNAKPSQSGDSGKALMNGPTKRDNIFTQLCNSAIPEITRYEVGLSTEERERKRKVAAAAALYHLNRPRRTSPPSPSSRQTETECRTVPGAPNNDVRCITKSR
jgi:hypothetical protein